MVTVSFQIPDELARDAEEFDILTEDILTALVADELDRRVMDFVNAEVHAYRAEKAAERPAQNAEDKLL